MRSATVAELSGGLTLRDGRGCLLTVPTEELPLPILSSVTVSPDATILTPTSAPPSVTIVGGTPATISWSPAATLSCTDCEGPVARPTESTTYTVTVTTDAGCVLTDTVRVALETVDAFEVYAPTAFSPNGDSNNDEYRFFSNDADATLSSFEVFDRWGN